MHLDNWLSKEQLSNLLCRNTDYCSKNFEGNCCKHCCKHCCMENFCSFHILGNCNQLCNNQNCIRDGLCCIVRKDIVQTNRIRGRNLGMIQKKILNSTRCFGMILGMTLGKIQGMKLGKMRGMIRDIDRTDFDTVGSLIILADSILGYRY